MRRRFVPLLHTILVLLGCSASQSTSMFAQRASAAGPRHDYEVAGSPVSASPVDKQIAAALQEVSAEKIKTNIETLVGFKNRNTTASTESDLAAGTGVSAAADWLKSQLGSYSQAVRRLPGGQRRFFRGATARRVCRLPVTHRQTDPDSQCVCGASRIRPELPLGECTWSPGTMTREKPM